MKISKIKKFSYEMLKRFKVFSIVWFLIGVFILFMGVIFLLLGIIGALIPIIPGFIFLIPGVYLFLSGTIILGIQNKVLESLILVYYKKFKKKK